MTMSEIFGLDSRWLFTALVATIAGERLLEVAISRRNARRLAERGGIEVGADHYPWMVLLHVLFLLAGPAEVWLLGRPFVPLLSATMAGFVIGAMALRYWVVSTLGTRWTTRVYRLPGVPPVTGGPFRFVRHPNYLAVRTEMVALPLVHTAWLTAMVFSVANLMLLRVRIREEEAALERSGDLAGRFPVAGNSGLERG